MAMNTIDLSKTPVELVLGLINRVNNTALTAADVTFGTPAEITADAEGRNTSLVVSPTALSVYDETMPITITYRRIPLSDLISGKVAADYTFSVGNATKISDLIPSINTLFGINLTGDDYVDADLPTGASKTTAAFTLAAKPGSLVFQDSVNLIAYFAAVPLSSVITETALDGFVYS